MTAALTAIAQLLRDRLDLPVAVTDEAGPYAPGVNVWRMVRHPYRGTLVRVMYAPQGESEERHEAWAKQVREVLLEAFPNRYRPLGFEGKAAMLIEDAHTTYARWRAAENAQRAALGWKPLHEIGK